MPDINKELSLLEYAIKTEESAVQIYTRHIESTLFLSEFDSENQKLITRNLKTLASESNNHKALLQERIRSLRGD